MNHGKVKLFYQAVSAGAVIIETVFEIPGMGRLSLEAIVGRDYPIFMGEGIRNAYDPKRYQRLD